jgi:hypothetical protein
LLSVAEVSATATKAHSVAQVVVQLLHRMSAVRAYRGKATMAATVQQVQVAVVAVLVLSVLTLRTRTVVLVVLEHQTVSLTHRLVGQVAVAVVAVLVVVRHLMVVAQEV